MFVHDKLLSQNRILIRILPNSSLILIIFTLPEAKDFSKLKPVISSIRGRLSKPVIMIPYLRSGTYFGILKLS